jgi:hypothetical protein
MDEDFTTLRDDDIATATQDDAWLTMDADADDQDADADDADDQDADADDPS